jgi:putative hydrolase of the HAD superfamily
VAALQLAHTSLPPARWGGVASNGFTSTAQRGRQYRRRGLILDLDDTLYPRERYIRSGFAAVAKYLERRWGVPAGGAFTALSKAFSGGHAGREFQAMCQKYELPREEVAGMLSVFRSHKPNLWLPYETGQALQRLRADGWRMVILTNGLPSVQAAKVDALALATMVDHVIYAETVSRKGKPDAATFLAALNRLDLSADRVVAVGDDPVRDIKGARALNLRTIRMARPEFRLKDGEEADVVIASMDHLPRAASGLLEMVTLDAA